MWTQLNLDSGSGPVIINNNNIIVELCIKTIAQGQGAYSTQITESTYTHHMYVDYQTRLQHDHA